MHVVGPGSRIDQGRVHVGNTESGVTFDSLACNGGGGPGLAGAGIVHEEVQHDRLNAYRQGGFQVQRR